MESKKENIYEFLCQIPRVDFYQKNLHYLPAVYYGQEHPRQYMECFYKDGCENMPVIIWIHGGAWDDEFLTASYRPEITLAELAEKGYFIACLEYRLARYAALPACLEDCQMAIEYLRKTADIYHIDPQKIGLWGESAGAHIACMVGSNYNNKKMMPVQGIVSFYCPSDLTEMLKEQNNIPGFLVIFGKTRTNFKKRNSWFTDRKTKTEFKSNESCFLCRQKNASTASVISWRSG